ncbi:MAG: hypothetical protein RJA07_1192 [Bacteroidota bacterium]
MVVIFEIAAIIFSSFIKKSNNYHMTKKTLQQLTILFSIVFTVVLSSTVFGQVTTTEGFESATFAPTGWKISPLVTGGPGGNQIWRRASPAGTNPTATPHAGTAMARFDSRNNAAGSTQTLISPVIDMSGRAATATSISMWVYRDTAFATQGDSLTIWMNTADTSLGATRLGVVARSIAIALPNTEATIGWYQYSFSVPSSFNTATNYLLIQGTSQRVTGGGPGATGRNMFIDDVTYTAFPPMCTGTPTVGTIVNSTNVICGGTGSAVLSLTSPITNASGITYDWQSSTSATGPFTTIAGSTNSITANTGTLSSPTLAMYYQCVVTCSASTLTYTTPVDTIKISSSALPVVAVTPTTVTLCSGTTTSLTASGAGLTSFTWSSTNAGLNATTGATVTATPAAGGGGGFGGRTIIVTGFDAIGCSDTAHAVLTVNNSPNATITSSIPNDTICTGTTVILTMPNAGGGPGGGATYSWSNGPVTRRDTISPTTTTTYIGTVTAGNGCSAADTVKIVVNIGTPPTVSVTPLTAVYCVGGAGVTLTASGTGTSYKWTPAATLNTSTGTTVVATPVGGGGPGGGATVYTVTASNGVCSASATATVTRSNPPTGNITSNIPNDTVCTGGTVILSAPAGGGFGGGYTYLWSTGSTYRRDTLVPTTNSMYTVLITNAGGCTKSDTIHIAVVPGTQPNLSTTPASPIRYCSSSASSATVSIHGATSYTWNNTNGVTFLNTANDSVSITPAGGPGGGNFTITGSIGACKSTITISVTAANAPNKINIQNLNPGTDTVCPGTTVILRGGPGGGNTYMWDDGKTTRNDTAIINMGGYKTITVSSAPGCSVVDSLLFVLSGGSAHFSYVADSSAVKFTDLSIKSTSWSWNFGDTTALGTTQNPTHNYAHYGLYSVVLTVTGPCGTYTDTMKVGIWKTGINDIAASQIYAYPNPVNDEVNLSFQMNSNTAELILINALGQVMEQKSITSKMINGYNERLSLAKYPNGVYTVKVKSNNNILNVRLIKSAN